MKKILYLFVVFALFVPVHIFAQIISIDSARALGVNATISVTGIVTNGNELGDIRYLQDATGGVAAYSYSMSGVNRGDSITVSGTLKDWNNLLEIDPVSTFNVVSSGHPSPAPLVKTPNQLGEYIEAQLVQINNVTFANAGGTFSGNSNYNFTVGTQTGEVRIYTASSLVGMVIPVGTVNIVGILSQYSYYPNDTTSGFQILLRDSNDIISNSAISMTTPVSVSNIDTSGFDLDWNTDIPGSSQIFYGNTPALELGVLSGTGGSTNHSVAITGANASEVFYVNAFSVAGTDTAQSSIKAFITKSNSTGVMKVYFTRSVDNSVSTGVNAVQLDDALDDTLIAYINRAKYSIDVAIYNFTTQNLSNISTAINNAYNNGIDIRVIFDGTGTTNTGVQQLNAGINTLASPNTSAYKIMHNKFVIIDANSPDPNDAILWTGSMNFTSTGVNSYANNIVITQDQSLARGYKLEFDEMWGSSTLTPNQANSRFGPFKTDNTPHEYIIGGKRVESYFSPSDAVNGKIIKTINSADSELLVETMLITRSDIAYAIRDAANGGASTKVIVNNKSGSMPGGSTTVIDAILSAIGNDFKEYGESGILHHKLMIVDQSNTSSDPLVFTGSHNWSNSADGENDENTLIIHDATIANLYYQEFVERFSLGTLIDGIMESTPLIHNVKTYPNPSDGRFAIDFESDVNQTLVLRIMDINGKVVLDNTFEISRGKNNININTENLTKGTYLVNIQFGEKLFTKKIMIL